MRIFLLVGLLLLGSDAMAASAVRVEVLGAEVHGDKQVKLHGVNAEGDMRIMDATWMKEEEKPFCLIASSFIPAVPEWTEYRFSFKPETSGTVVVMFHAEWDKDKTKRHWIAIREIKLNGESYGVEDFTHIMDGKDNKKKKKAKNKKGELVFSPNQIPARIELDDGAAVLVNHDNKMLSRLEVTGGKTYRIIVVAKDASAYAE